jgi:hypothetical protein
METLTLNPTRTMNKKLKVLELFAGSRSIGKAAESIGMEVLSLDKFVAEGNRLISVEEITREWIVSEMRGEPNIIWGSPVCSVWSKTGWFHYWDTDIYAITKQFIAKNPFANESVEMVRKTIEVFSWFPNAVFGMENPEGMLQMHPVTSYFRVYGIPARKTTVTYCQYGDVIRKPTQIWNNCHFWESKSPCKNGDNCHKESPRGSMKGIFEKKGNYERSVIPRELCLEFLRAAQEQVLNVEKPSAPQIQGQLNL